MPEALYDVFICHASEDKDQFVRPLADALRAEHVDVWYDEFALKLGDSLRRAIDRGLAHSRYGVVVLSPAFFEKEWTQYELDGLTDREMSGRDKVILPIWHGVGHEDVARVSPPLAARRAVSSNDFSRVIREIREVVHPSGSPLVIARDAVLQLGGAPPVVTDIRWLQAVEASTRIPGFGASVPPYSSWEGWSFPLPPRSDDPTEWGERLAWAFLQLDWTEAADRENITPLTDARVVHDFVHRFPGLLETCAEFPDLVAEYAPQLTIRGLEGPLKSAIDKGYRASCARQAKVIAPKQECEEEWALRHPTLGGHDRATVAYAYFSGGMFGPQVSPYEHADHLFWLLSDSSRWLPDDIREVLTVGFAECGAWRWHTSFSNAQDWPEAGALAMGVQASADSRKKFAWTADMKLDLRKRIAASKRELGLSGSAKSIEEKFFDLHIPGLHIQRWRELRRRTRRAV